MRRPLLALMLMTAPALAQLPAPVIDNARVTVRDIHLEPGKPGPAIAHAGYFAVLYFDGGRIRIADGHTVSHPAGDAVTGRGGVTHDTALGKPQREIVVELKDAPSNTRAKDRSWCWRRPRCGCGITPGCPASRP